jgi:hypothetical protein
VTGNGHHRYAVALLPPGELGEQTELVFIDGRPFVNADLHKFMVDTMLAELERQHRSMRFATCLNLVLAAALIVALL